MDDGALSTRASFSIYGHNTYIERVAPVTLTQSRIHSQSASLDDSTLLNITLQYQILGPLEPAKLVQAFRTVALHHEALRTCFFLDEETNELMQGILNTPTFELDCRQVRGDSEISDEVERFSRYDYDLEIGDTVKANLLSLDPETHILIIGHHRLVLDGFSHHVVLSDLHRAYQSQTLQSVPQHADFATMQRALVGNGLANEFPYWRDEFATLPPMLPLLPGANVKARQNSIATRSTVFEFALTEDVSRQVKTLSFHLQVTPSQLHLSLLQLLVLRLVGEGDVCIGVTDAGRADELAGSVGFFENMLPVRYNVQDSDTFEQLIAQTQRKSEAAVRHSRMSIDALLQELGVPDSSTHNPLFQVAFTYRTRTYRMASFGDCRVDSSLNDAAMTLDLIVNIEDGNDGFCRVMFVGQAYLYSEDLLHALASHYTGLLDQVLRHPSLPLGDYTLEHAEKEAAKRVDSPTSGSLIQSALVMTARGTWELSHMMPIPNLTPDSVLVKVEAIALNPLDWKLPDYSPTPGAIGGSDFCGTITAIGSQSLLLIGDRVCGWVFGSNPQRPDNGAFAEYVCASSDLLIKVPPWMSSVDACTLGLASATAGFALYRSLQLPLPTAPAEKPFYVLVNGGSTATGTMAIQLLKL